MFQDLLCKNQICVQSNVLEYSEKINLTFNLCPSYYLLIHIIYDSYYRFFKV